MNSYEYRPKTRIGERWNQISLEATQELLEQSFGNQASATLKRIDNGETVTVSRIEIRRYDITNEPVVSRPELTPEPDGDLLWA
jgi:hypothetical protein